MKPIPAPVSAPVSTHRAGRRWLAVLRLCIGWLLAALLRWRWPRRGFAPCRARTQAACVQAGAARADCARHWRKKPRWVEQQVLYLATHLKSCRVIADTFNKIHGKRATVSKTWVHEFCRRRAAVLVLLRRGARGKPPAAVPVRSAWSLDLSLLQCTGG